jgi:uncharacterized protein (TIGR02996 family)
MLTRDNLHRVARARPGDAVTRLVLADALEDRGEDRLARSVREHVAGRTRWPLDPFRVEVQTSVSIFMRDAAELFRTYLPVGVHLIDVGPHRTRLSRRYGIPARWWWRPADLPRALIERLPVRLPDSTVELIHRVPTWCTTRGAAVANVALSVACLRFGRESIGLPPEDGLGAFPPPI